MEASKFKTFLTQIDELTRSQCAQELALLTSFANQGRMAEIIEVRRLHAGIAENRRLQYLKGTAP